MSSGFQARPNAGVRNPVVEMLYEGGAGNIALGSRGCIGPYKGGILFSSVWG
jgi:hypothetical protein